MNHKKLAGIWFTHKACLCFHLVFIMLTPMQNTDSRQYLIIGPKPAGSKV